jgi:hypothetical protein
MSSKYTFIPTSTVLTAMRAAGFQPYEARQAGARSAERAPYTRHMLRFRHGEAKTFNDLVPEVILVNGHDGSAKYQVFGGLFRLVCLNGLMVGQQFAHMDIRHTGDVAGQVLEGSFKIVEEELPRIVESVGAMRARQLTLVEQTQFAQLALDIRYGQGGYTTISPAHLSTVHRSEDAANDMWTVFNRVQENIMSVNHTTRSASGRVSHVREVNSVKEQVRINRALWDAAMAIAA